MPAPEWTPDWTAVLRQLREALPGRREGGQVVGSLRWLEAELGRRGGNPAALRNIVYRNVGTPEDKRHLRAILRDLARQAGLEPEETNLRDSLPPAIPEGEHLSTGKRRLYRRFLAEVRRGRRARMLVVAPPGAGKTILVDALAHALPDSVRLRVEGDFAPELERLAEQLGLGRAWVAGAVGELDEQAAFAVNGARQQELSRELVQGLIRLGAVILLRVGENGMLGGHPLRLPDGVTCTLTEWVWHHLLLPLGMSGPPLFVAVASASGLPAELGPYRELLPLPSPSLEDARRFVRSKLPDLPPPRVERIVKQAGRDYDALGLLTLLAGIGDLAPQGTPLPPLRDRALREFLLVVDVCFSPEIPEVELGFLEALLGNSLQERRDLERAFLEVSGQRVRPTRPGLAGELLRASQGHGAVSSAHQANASQRQALHRRALHLALESGQEGRAFQHALRGQLWEELLRLPLGGVALEQAWRVARSAEYPPAVTEYLARQVAAEYALRGQYGHPEMLDALELLAQAQDENMRAWAAVKRAEALIDAARFTEAKAQLEVSAGHDPVIRAEYALAHAAVARWQGQPDRAQTLLNEAEAVVALAPPEQGQALGVKVRLWRSLCTKDLGDWKVALPLLAQVMEEPGASPVQRARAAYQLGDALMRLGQQEQAREALEKALHGLELHRATLDECSRARARLASVLRRLGRLAEAQEIIEEAVRLAPDAFTRGRALSEAVPLYAAQGHTEAALLAGRRAWAIFSGAERERPSEAQYRRLRVEYRVALAYLARSLAQPYLPPIAGARQEHPDLAHARQLLERVQATLPETQADRVASLRVDAALALALATPDPAAAENHARRALDAAAHPYQGAQARVGLAEALLRAGNQDGALLEVTRAHRAARQAAALSGAPVWNEPGLDAWLALLEFGATFPQDEAGAWQGLQLALHDPQLVYFHGVLAAQAAELLRGAGRVALADELTADPLLAPGDGARFRFLAPGSWES